MTDPNEPEYTPPVEGVGTQIYTAHLAAALKHMEFNDTAIDNIMLATKQIGELKAGQILVKSRRLREMYKNKRIHFTYGTYGHVSGIMTDFFKSEEGRLSTSTLVVVDTKLYELGYDVDIIVDVNPQ